MIISQTPFRISFFGGGTDFPLWYRENGGSVLSTTINKYAYITCRHLPPFFEHKHRIVYSQVETVKRIEEIVHPAVRNIFQYLNIEDGLEVHYDGDLPARSGLGSSSSFTVGMLNTLFAMRGQMKTKRDLADLALHIEQNVIKETVGSQDQIAAAFGGFNRIEFHNDEKYSVQPMILPQSRVEMLNDRLLLFFTGFSRIAETVEKSKIENFKAKSAHLQRMQEMVGDAVQVLQSDTGLDDFGRMLHETWSLKRELSDKVSNSKLDEIYEVGMKNGALGGKILGAGGGGFILFYAPPETHANICDAFSSLIKVDFKFEYGGSQIILYNPDMASHGPRETRMNNLTMR